MQELSYKRFPVINFIGNKSTLAEWIYKNAPKNIKTALDVFSGSGAISYLFKVKGKRVIANDAMISNFMIAKATIENSSVRLDSEDREALITENPHRSDYFEKNYTNVKFFKKECVFLDNVRANIDKLNSPYKQALAFTAVRRAMIRKMPYSRFNIPWKLIKILRDEELSYKRWGRKRAYHNVDFELHLSDSIKIYNDAVFDNGEDNKALNLDVLKALENVKDADLVYFDPPYAGKMNDYQAFYGLIDEFILLSKPAAFQHDFTKKTTILALFKKMFDSARHINNWMMSYNSRSLPKKDELLSLLKTYGAVDVIERQHAYKLTNAGNKDKDKEYLFLVRI